MRMPSPVWAAVATLALASAVLLGPPRADASRTHTVRAGQTLGQIAQRYRVSVDDIKAANRMRGTRIRAGQELTIPTAGEVYARPGQTLERIARANDVSVESLRRANHLRGNPRLRAGQRLILPGFEPAPTEPESWGEPEAPGVVELRRAGEEPIVATLRVEEGVSRTGLRYLEGMLRRDERDIDRHTTPRMALLLAQISDHFGGRTITVVSGFRDPRRFSGSGSQHVAGIASDIQVQGVPHRTVWEYCRTIDAVGCGFYPRSSFVHVDAREERTHWVDWSRPGRRPRYGTLRGPAPRGRRPFISMPDPTETLPIEVPVVEDDPMYVAPMPSAQPAPVVAGGSREDDSEEP
ncbi:MAG: LysM peptidoglycan-binding domain-containing protein [Sandaracinaceae bacterium]|nr:LysM peptidoglycan-binding domain-containing protein [Sandaracinaceae bacterium]